MIERRIAERADPLPNGFQEARVAATGLETAFARSVMKLLGKHR
jgi:hypothetical protein